MTRIVSMTGLLVALALSGCVSANRHATDVQQGVEGDRLTVGNVQKEIRVGMSGAEVAAALGSPNIVTTDEKRREVWIYDRISTTNAYSTSRGGLSALVLGLGSNAAGLGSASGDYSSGASATTQRTLTVIIRYDAAMRVRDFDYHASRF